MGMTNRLCGSFALIQPRLALVQAAGDGNDGNAYLITSFGVLATPHTRGAIRCSLDTCTAMHSCPGKAAERARPSSL